MNNPLHIICLPCVLLGHGVFLVLMCSRSVVLVDRAEIPLKSRSPRKSRGTSGCSPETTWAAPCWQQHGQNTHILNASGRVQMSHFNRD